MTAQASRSDEEALVAALQLVAAEPAQQLGALSALRRLADELRQGRGEALEWSTAALQRSGAWTPALARLIDEVDDAFAALADEGDEAFTPAALSTHAGWAALRVSARRALMALGVPRTPPELPE